MAVTLKQAQLFEQSAERAALAVAIERRDRVQRELGALNATIGSFWERTSAASAAIEAAQKVADEAKDNCAKFELDKALGRETGEPPITLMAARALVAAAQEERESLEGTRASMRVMQRELESSLRLRDGDVHNKAGAVVMADPAVAALIGEFVAVRARFADLRGVVDMLSDRRLIPASLGFYRGDIVSNVAADRWRAALKVLESDSAVELPP